MPITLTLYLLHYTFLLMSRLTYSTTSTIFCRVSNRNIEINKAKASAPVPPVTPPWPVLQAAFHLLSPAAPAKNLGFIPACSLCLSLYILLTRKSCWLYPQNAPMLCVLLCNCQSGVATKGDTGEARKLRLVQSQVLGAQGQ